MPFRSSEISGMWCLFGIAQESLHVEDFERPVPCKALTHC